METIAVYLSNWIKERVAAAGAAGGVIGISGGIDSAVVAALTKRAFPNHSLGILMPCQSNPIDMEYGEMLVRSLDLESRKVDLTITYNTLLTELAAVGSEDAMALANIKPRLRMTALYYYAALNNYLVIGTGNKSELHTGYFTKYGDGGVDIEPIGTLYKCQVYELAEYLGIPKEIMDRPPTAGLWENQTDEKEMGITYRELDNYLCRGTGSERITNVVDQLHRKSQHKREVPPVPEKEFPLRQN